MEAVSRRRWEAAGFLGPLRRVAVPATAASILGIGAADEPGELRGVVGITGGIAEIHPVQALQVGRELQFLEFDGDEPVAVGIELVVVVDLPLHPFRLQRFLRADDDGEAAVPDSLLAERLQLAGDALPLVEPDAQAVLFLE